MRVTRVGYDEAYKAVGARVLLHAPRDDPYAGYFATALLAKLERGEHGFLHLFLDEIRLLPEVVPTSTEGLPIEGNQGGAEGGIKFHKYAPGLRLITGTTYQTILSAGGASLQILVDKDGKEWGEPDQELFIDATTESAMRRYRFRQELVRMQLRNKLLESCGAVCCLSGRRPNVPQGPSLLTLSHYWPLGHYGPDNLHNTGLMTCMVHQIWENGLVAMLPDWSLVFAPDIPPLFLAEFNGKTCADYPDDPTIWPDPLYLDYHRVNILEKRLRRLN